MLLPVPRTRQPHARIAAELAGSRNPYRQQFLATAQLSSIPPKLGDFNL
jgi:hypothetical protein